MNKTDALLEQYKNSDAKLIKYIKSLGVDLGNNFNIDLLKRAFTHKSFSNDVHKKLDSNERLEFLGDAILGFIIADMLYHENIPMGEDMMSLYKIALVNEKILAEVAREIKAGDYILLGLGELNSDGRNKDSVLSDFIEALIAYIYIDLGEQQAKMFIVKHIYSKFLGIKESGNIKSPKSILQEFLQNKHKLIPKYIDYEEEIDEKGNIIKYKSEVYLEDRLLAEGFGPNKKKAQTEAAEKAMKNINKG